MAWITCYFVMSLKKRMVFCSRLSSGIHGGADLFQLIQRITLKRATLNMTGTLPRHTAILVSTTRIHLPTDFGICKTVMYSKFSSQHAFSENAALATVSKFY
jgi:hypothetical protein